MSGNFSCPSIDFVFLQDLSGSYADDLPILQSQIANVIGTVEGIDADAQFAVASFIDKPTGGFGAGDDYVYQTHLSMTGDDDAVIAAMNALTTQSGLDVEEAQLEALMHVALREDEIGFRAESNRIVMLSTDSAFHEAGDFATAPANNGDTVLDGGGIGEDYPSIAMTAAALAASGVFPVFSVTSTEAPLYQALVDDLGTGAVVILSSDSSDFADAVRVAIAYSCGYVTEQGTEGDDDLEGTEIEDGVFGLGGDDDLDGHDGDDIVDGGSGDDICRGGRGDDDVFGGTGNDRVFGGHGSDFLFGGIGNDRLLGGRGLDTFVVSPGDGRDIIADFTDGDDLIDLSAFKQFEGVAAVANARQIGSNVVMTLPDGTRLTIRNFDLASLGLEDVLVNPDGDPPGAVDDTANVTSGVAAQIDVLRNDSDPNGDTLSIISATASANATVSVTADGKVSYTATAGFTGSDSFTYTISDGALISSATVTVTVAPNLRGDAGDNVLTGTAGADLILGFAGDDTIHALGGDDTINGGTGNDTIEGGIGRDIINGGAGNDVIVAGPGTTGDLADKDVVDGGIGRDTIYGGWGDDSLSGGGGNDTIFGELGDDKIFGDDGDDTLNGGEDNDEIDGGAGDDTINGGSGNDQIGGDAGNDIVSGGSGDDEIRGAGATDAELPDDDILSGGTGADVFLFELSLEKNLSGDDVITDYDVTEDILQLDGDVLVRLTDTIDGVLVEQVTGGSILIEDVLADDLRPTIAGLVEIL